jgi:DUF971 family protein
MSAAAVDTAASQPGPRAESSAPEAIIDHALSGVLEIRWCDGTASRLPHALLRRCCRCAACEQLRRMAARAGGADAFEGPAALPGTAAALAAIHFVGDRGLNLVFGDGHGRGIYPWAYLRQLGAGPGHRN